MKPLNKEDRSKAFLNFLLLFIITIAIIITTIFFSVQVPFKQNDQLLKQMNAIHDERMILDSFSRRMEETMSLLNNVNTVPGNEIFTENTITDNLTQMSKMVADSIPGKSLYTNIIYNLFALQQSKKQLRDANAKNTQCETDKKSLDEELKRCKDSYDRILRASQ